MTEILAIWVWLIGLYATLGPGAIFIALMTIVIVGLGGISAFEQKKEWGREALEGLTGVSEWRGKLNGVTEGFVKLGSNKMLERAASKSADPNTKRWTGKTLEVYTSVKGAYLAVTFAYAALSSTVQRAENALSVKSFWKLVRVRHAMEIGETPVHVRECNTAWFAKVLQVPNGSPKAPQFMPGYLFEATQALITKINGWIKDINEAPAQVKTRLAAADQAMAKCRQQYEDLKMNKGTDYAPYANAATTIELTRGQVAAAGESDPMGAVAKCGDLDKQIADLTGQLAEAAKLLGSINSVSNTLAEKFAWLGRVRKTEITCPWVVQPEGAASVCWALTSPESDPDVVLEQTNGLIEKAKLALIGGDHKAVSQYCQQALGHVAEAEKIVKAQFDAKTSVDEQVPKLRVELSSLREELLQTTGGMTPAENAMAQPVETACKAVEQRIEGVRKMYEEQRFTEALLLLTGSQNNEHGAPISKLMAAAKELLRLLKEAQKTAASVKAQLA